MNIIIGGRYLILIPIIAFIASLSLNLFSTLWFWRFMAYLAIFHFIKQQYGFARLFKLKEERVFKNIISDKLIVYFSTLYPIVYWHFNSSAEFNWFVKNDFFNVSSLLSLSTNNCLFTFLNVFYWCVIFIWLVGEIKSNKKKDKVSIGRILWILTTAFNWFFGIVYFNSDFIFSITNVIAHGIPYVYLIWFYNYKKNQINNINNSFSRTLKLISVFILTILFLALIEEYLWDMLIYRDHEMIFNKILPYEFNQLSGGVLYSIVISVLALPQLVHYIIDGFIWKFNSSNPYLKSIFKK